MSQNMELDINSLSGISQHNLIELYRQGYKLKEGNASIQRMQATPACTAEEVEIPLINKCIKKNYLIIGGIGVVALFVFIRK